MSVQLSNLYLASHRGCEVYFPLNSAFNHFLSQNTIGGITLPAALAQADSHIS